MSRFERKRRAAIAALVPLHEEVPAVEALPENDDQAAERLRLEIEIDDDSDVPLTAVAASRGAC